MSARQTGQILDPKSPWYCWWTETTKDRAYDPVFHRIDALTPIGKLWRERFERPALFIEIVRRFAFKQGNKRFEQMRFDRLPEQEQNNIVEIFTPAQAPPIFTLPDESKGEEVPVFEPEDYVIIPPLYVRSDLTDHAIKSLSLAEIRKLIPKPQKQTRAYGKTNDPSWLWPELMNGAYFMGSELEKSEQDVLRLVEGKAENLYARWLSYFGEG
jgi:hypothetical protein